MSKESKSKKMPFAFPPGTFVVAFLRLFHNRREKKMRYGSRCPRKKK